MAAFEGLARLPALRSWIDVTLGNRLACRLWKPLIEQLELLWMPDPLADDVVEAEQRSDCLNVVAESSLLRPLSWRRRMIFQGGAPRGHPAGQLSFRIDMASCGEVKLGSSVRYQQRDFIVRGFTRASSVEQYVVLEEAETGEVVTVLLAQLEAEENERDP
jgi:hypothetical protein